MAADIRALLGLFRAFLTGVTREPVRGFLSVLDAAPMQRDLEPHALPCLAHLDRAAALASGPARPLATWLAANRASLRWGQTYTEADFGRDFIDGYGWLELIGTRGHFASESLAAGFLLLGPDIVYPDHHHVAEEVYIPLTGGTEWRKGEGDFRHRAALDIIHHPSDVNHAMRTGADPLLAIYLWRGGPLAQKSVIGRA